MSVRGIEPEVLKIAKEVRDWAEAKADKWNFPSDLMGMCAIAAAELHVRLKRAGYASKIGYNSSHCFVIYKDHVLDVTATQFGTYEKVFVAARGKYIFHKERRVFSDIRDLVRVQRQYHWPLKQRASRLRYC